MASTQMAAAGNAPTKNQGLLQWVSRCARMTQPDRIVWCDGSEEEKKRLTEQAVKEGILIPLNQEKLPGCYLHRSNPNDVARVEHLTFICTPNKTDAGPTNNWMEPEEAYAKLGELFDGCMKGRTMYVVPYVMGPLGSPLRQGRRRAHRLHLRGAQHAHHDPHGRGGAGAAGRRRTTSTACLHSTGDVNPERRYICHFPQDNTIWSFGSGYGGNVLLGKKCLALRIASYLGREEGWMAEHMLILGVTNPQGEKTYVAAAFPSACGKTNFAMMIPPERVQGLEDRDRRRRHRLDAGRPGRPAVRHQPRGRLLRRGARHQQQDQPQRDGDDRQGHHLHQRGADAGRGRLVGGQGRRGARRSCTDWQGRPWTPGSGEKAAHPNSRFTAPMAQQPGARPARRTIRRACPIGAIIFGGRRAQHDPAGLQAFNWVHGVFLGATMGSETTAAATGKVGVVRRDPDGHAAVLRLQHGRLPPALARHAARRITHLPKIFQVNWFRQDDERQVPVAGLRREHARARVDREPRPRPRAHPGDAAGLGAAQG